MIKKLLKHKEGRKRIVKRAKGTREFLKAAGIVPGLASRSGAGRPKGTYKYGMPIQEYKKLQARKKALYQQYQQEQYVRLRPKGFTPEQIQQLQQMQTVEKLRRPQMQEQVQQQMQQQQMQQVQRQSPQQILQQLRKNSAADEELAFRRWSAERTITPRTQRMLDNIRRIQLKGQRDNIEQQRRHKERMLVGRSMNLMKAHENMTPTQIDFTGVNPEENILMAPSVFKENPENNILRPRQRNVLDMGENNLKFF